MLRLFRLTHLYLGIFIAPALLFFAFTGALQTFSLHETHPGSDYKPARWIASLAQLHKKQSLTVPPRRPRPAAEAQSTPAAPANAATITAPAGAARPAQKKHLLMKIFFLVVSVGLLISTMTGIYMAYRYNRSKLIVTVLLAAGIVVPLALLRF